MVSNILFFFAALGLFNALVLCLYLLLLKKETSAFDYFLGLLLFFLFIRVGVSCFYYFGPIPIPLIKIGLMANVFLGPTLLFITKIDTKTGSISSKGYAKHMSILALLATVFWLSFQFHIWNHVLRFFFHFILTVYLILAGLSIWKSIREFFTGQFLSTITKKVVALYISVVLVCVGFAVSLVSSYILGPLFFSLVFYGTFAYCMGNRKRTVRSKSSRRKIEDAQFQPVAQKLAALMETEKLYKNPDLNLDILVDKLGKGRHFLSQLLNDNLEKNFFQYVNEFRIKEACSMLSSKHALSVEAIGYEVGFRSKSAFFAAFKKIKGTTPSKYRASISTV